MTLEDMDLFEVNEAFASVVLSWAQQTGADLEQDERQRWRDRAGSPGRLDRHPTDHHRAARARATRPDPRADLHVRRRRDGDRDGPRADLASGPGTSGSAQQGAHPTQARLPAARTVAGACSSSSTGARIRVRRGRWAVRLGGALHRTECAVHRLAARPTAAGRPAGTQVWPARQTMSCRRLSTNAFTVQNGAADMAAVPRLTSGVGTGRVGTCTREARRPRRSRRAGSE